MASIFKTIGLLGREDNSRVMETLASTRDFLEQRGVEVFSAPDAKTLLAQHSCDLVVVVGGDGSLLGASRTLARRGVPVLGVNRGRFGFLTDLLPKKMSALFSEILEGNYSVEKRFLLGAELVRDGKKQGAGDALNDVVVSSGASAQMVEFELHINDSFVYSQRSDGIIISTPTGSTAYSLSAGGPIMHPQLNAVLLVPMFPHTLSGRPLIVHGDSELRIVVGEHNELKPQLFCDGQVELNVIAGDEVRVKKKKKTLHLIHPQNQDFYASCRDKLGWGKRPDEQG